MRKIVEIELTPKQVLHLIRLIQKQEGWDLREVQKIYHVLQEAYIKVLGIKDSAEAADIIINYMLHGMKNTLATYKIDNLGVYKLLQMANIPTNNKYAKRIYKNKYYEEEANRKTK